ncbi:MAG: flagellar M-ring protein FliF [Deltaproteobacteria bacterium]|nr:MAG: flagellar M-ring protein FliF [Deltaproteobacteria bacterium]
MADGENKGTPPLVEVFRGIPLGKKISFAVVACLLIGGFVALMTWTNRPDYQILFANLETSDAAQIADKLREKRIPFLLEDGGRAILVPDDKVYDLRLELASQGLPRGGNVGFEVFDKMPFGTTEFVQRLKYQQALQGELARTIMDFDSVAQARVHIVQPDESLFVEPEQQARASVVLKLSQGRSLDRRQLQGIVNLVACAVKNLRPENVTVVDVDRGLLIGPHEDSTVGPMSEDQFEYKRMLEKTLENRIRSMLEPVVGHNKVVAKVSAEVDFKQVHISEETYDPDSAVIRSEQRQKEKAIGGKTLPSGSPDLKYEVYQTSGQTSASTNQIEKENSVINYEINRVNKQIISAAGDVKRLSAAVIIDGPYTVEKDEKGNEVRKFVPRSRKEMKNFEEIVKKAIGFNEARGDQVTISNVPFAIQKEKEIQVASKSPWLGYLKKGSKPFFNVILIFLFFFFVVRPFKNWLNQAKEYVGPQALPPGKELPQLASGGEGGSIEAIRKEEILDISRAEPDKIAEVIRRWVREGS